jgi:primosomal protein N' (replication factor Y)
VADQGDQLWLLPRSGETRAERVADVAVRLRTHRIYTYSIPDALVPLVRPGVAIRVPHAKSRRMIDGWCVRVSQLTWDSTRQPIAEVTSPRSLLTPALIDVAIWISEYYVCPPGVVIEAMTPASLRAARVRRRVFLRATQAATSTPLSAKRAAVLAALGAGERARRDFVREAAVSPAVLRALIRAGLIERVEREELVEPSAPESESRQNEPAADNIPTEEDAYVLTASQAVATREVCAVLGGEPAFRVFLLYGVPGSGKTEVYVRAIREAVAAGRQAILLVPEIALATQVVQRLARRFTRVAVLHSRLTARTRAAALQAIAAGDVDVVIGTRTAVFAPCPRLGLIVVDEEQESSFKSLAAPYYHARDVAIKRGQLERVPVLLGSATPSLESWHNAHHLPHFRLLRLAERVPGAALPRVQAIDVRRGGQRGDAVLSGELRAAIQRTLEDRQQAVLLHNRRGYAAQLRCTVCGLAAACVRCGAFLVEHRAADVLKCHRCGARHPRPTQCLDSTCSGPLERSGLAIQKLEEELRVTFPAARLLRLDRDTMRRREDYAAALGAFERREAEILLGTQMVAKGLDFPGVRLVGVLDADSMLGFPDFRASEHAFQLLMQVVGRAGRKEGESLALIQTSDPGNATLRRALALDYEGFARDEVAARRELGYPPFGRLVRIVCSDEEAKRAREAAVRMAGELRRIAGGVHAGIVVEDAQPCLIARLRGRYRYEVVMRTPRDGSVQKMLHEALAGRVFAGRVGRVAIDVDPSELT